jgi:hypothetical protein
VESEKMTHNYVTCEKALQDCRWCKAHAEKILRSQQLDVQELDWTLTFSEQEILQHVQQSQDDGVHNDAARQLLELDKRYKRRKKGRPMDIGRVVDALDYLGAPIRRKND